MLLIKSQVVLSSYSGGHLLSGKAHLLSGDTKSRSGKLTVRCKELHCIAGKARQSGAVLIRLEYAIGGASPPRV